MSDIFFNDLTMRDHEDDFLESLARFAKLWKKIADATGAKRVMCVDDAVYARMFLPEIQENRELRQFALSVMGLAYSGDVPRSSFVTRIDNQYVSCNALGRAAKSGMISLGMVSNDPWNRIAFEVQELISDGSEREIYDALQFTEEIQLTTREFKDWLEETYFGNIKTCSVLPINKRCRLRDDHGIDVLLRFAKRILNSQYVLSIVNSLPFKSNSRQFIEHVSENGLINLRLHWTDKGYGMVVQTTGENLAQTRKIANLLKEYELHS